MKPTIAQIIRFLRMLEDDGLGYSAINVARSALSVVLPRVGGQPVGKHQVISWFIRAVYERNPPKPRYSRFWDVSLVFSLFKRWESNRNLSLKDLGSKVAVLLLLTTGRRGQTIVALNIDSMELEGDQFIFELKTLTKSNHTGDPLSTVTITSFPETRKICVVRALKEYLRRTSDIRKSKQLLVSYVKPHGGISRDTLARWTVRVLQQAGVDTTRFGSHSTRGAMASNARMLGVSVKAILQHAGWKTETSFARHYNKRVEDAGDVSRQLLRHN